ncbi:23S rRNA (guanosine(2251)-2'-O)-methyltransferase RlmB [Desulfobacterota bacterium M19]
MANLERKKGHKAKDTDLIWGIHPVMELLSSNPAQILELWFQKTITRAGELVEAARRQGVPYRLIENLNDISPAAVKHQGVMARIRPFNIMGLNELLKIIRRQQTVQPLIVALDSIQDPHNFGAIIRSAAAAGALGIIFAKDRAAPLSGTVAKVSVGAVSRVNLCQVNNISKALKALQDEGFWVFGAAGDGGQSLYETDFNGPVCIVIGSEDKGIRPLVKEQCDFLVRIPMAGGIESLNASTAAAVIMFEIVRCRTL